MAHRWRRNAVQGVGRTVTQVVSPTHRPYSFGSSERTSLATHSVPGKSRRSLAVDFGDRLSTSAHSPGRCWSCRTISGTRGGRPGLGLNGCGAGSCHVMLLVMATILPRKRPVRPHGAAGIITATRPFAAILTIAAIRNGHIAAISQCGHIAAPPAWGSAKPQVNHKKEEENRLHVYTPVSPHTRGGPRCGHIAKWPRCGHTQPHPVTSQPQRSTTTDRSPEP